MFALLFLFISTAFIVTILCGFFNLIISFMDQSPAERQDFFGYL